MDPNAKPLPTMAELREGKGKRKGKGKGKGRRAGKVEAVFVTESACACSDCVNTQLVRNYRRHAHFVISVSAVNFSCQLFRPFLYSVKKYLAHSTQCKKKHASTE